MKFLLEFMACYGSRSSTSMVKEEARLLAASVQPPSSEIFGVRGRKRGRKVGTARSESNNNSGGGGSSGVEWRPSLSSICEDNVLHEIERNKNDEHHPHHQEAVPVVRSTSSSERILKRKITSTPRPRSHCPREDVRRPAVHAVMPTFSPAPFTF